MQRFNTNDLGRAPSTNPIFIGSVTAGQMVDESNASLLRVTLVAFHDGARNRLHHHDADQVLVVTSGKGIIASESERFEVEPGDVVLISAGERHWHGAQEGQDMAHLSILTPGAVTIDEPAP